MFLTHYQEIREATQEAAPTLFNQDLDRILEGLSERIDQFHGDPNGFIEWAVNVAQDSAQVAEKFLEMRNDPENREAVRTAIGSILKGCAGLGVVHEDTLSEIEADFWTNVLQDLPDWLMPSYSLDPKRPPASLPTRLFAKAMWAARAWKTTRVREKERLADEKLSDRPTRVRGRKAECLVEY